MLRGHPAILCTVLWSPLRLFKLGGYFPGMVWISKPVVSCIEKKSMSHWHFTIVFALVFITVQLQPIFVLFVAISLSYVAISRTCHTSEFYLNKASICIVHLTCSHQWRIRRRPRRPLFLDQAETSQALKKIFFNMGPPIISGSGWPTLPPPPLIWRSGSPLTIPLGSPKEKSQG